MAKKHETPKVSEEFMAKLSGKIETKIKEELKVAVEAIEF
jgi:hypothetical protein